MNRRHPASIVFILALTASSIGLSSARAFDEPTPTDLGPILAPLREKFQAPGLAAAAVRDGRLIAIGTAGVRSLQSNEPVAAADRSLIGSCGKAATRLLIGRLVDKGKLRWDSTLAELLPDVTMRDEYKSVTLGDIISHKGGLQPYTMISPDKTPVLFNQTGSPREQRAAFAAHLLNEPPAAPPKTLFFYSNAGYGLLGHIAERAADESYEQLMRDEVFGPLEMSSAIVGSPRVSGVIPGWGGHERTPKGFESILHDRPGLPPIVPAGQMSMSISDFAKLAATLVNVESGKPTGFLGKSAVERLPELRPGVKGGEGEIFLGGDGQYTAAFALWPSKGLAIVVQTNAGESDDLCEALVDAVRAAVAPDIPSRKTPGAASADRPRYGFQIRAESNDDTWLVGAVASGSPAEFGGLKQGDRILAINGTPIPNLPVDDPMAALKQPTVKLQVERDGKLIDLTLRLP